MGPCHSLRQLHTSFEHDPALRRWLATIHRTNVLHLPFICGQSREFGCDLLSLFVTTTMPRINNDGGDAFWFQRAQCDIEVKALAALTALPEPALRQKLAGGGMIAPQASMLSVAALPAQVLAQRPDVYQAELEVAAASAEVGASRADRYPRLTLSGTIAAGYVRAGGRGTDAPTWQIGPLSLTLPIFDAGRREAATDAAQARYEEAAALYRARVRQAVREVEEALVALDSARSRNEDARIATEGYRMSFTATEARYKGGLASLVELEDARRTALAAETALVALQRERVAAWIALYRAAGGGWTRQDTTTSMGKS